MAAVNMEFDVLWLYMILQHRIWNCTNHTLIFFLHVTYSVFLVNNIYLFHRCSVIPLYVVLQNILCMLFSKWRNKIITYIHISFSLTQSVHYHGYFIHTKQDNTNMFTIKYFEANKLKLKLPSQCFEYPFLNTWYVFIHIWVSYNRDLLLVMSPKAK